MYLGTVLTICFMSYFIFCVYFSGIGCRHSFFLLRGMPSRFCFVHCCGILFRPSLSGATSVSSETPLLKISHEILRLWDSLPFWYSVAVWIFWSFRICYPKVSKSQLSHCIFFCSGTLGTLGTLPGFLRTSTMPTMSYHFFILTVLTVLTVSHPK